ncbi:hypothetical protein NN561_007617 [Cricetulus griseus]
MTDSRVAAAPSPSRSAPVCAVLCRTRGRRLRRCVYCPFRPVLLRTGSGATWTASEAVAAFKAVATAASTRRPRWREKRRLSRSRRGSGSRLLASPRRPLQTLAASSSSPSPAWASGGRAAPPALPHPRPRARPGRRARV